MSTTNINLGNAISVGNNNTVIGNSIGLKSEDIKISLEDIEILKNFSDELLKYKGDAKSSDIRKASAIIYELVEASEENDKEKQVEAITNWSKFKEKVSENTINAISMVSNIITIGTYLSSLLGL